MELEDLATSRTSLLEPCYQVRWAKATWERDLQKDGEIANMTSLEVLTEHLFKNVAFESSFHTHVPAMLRLSTRNSRADATPYRSRSVPLLRFHDLKHPASN